MMPLSASNALRRSVAGTAILVDVGLEYGIPAARSLRGTGLTESDLRDLALEILPQQELAVGRNLLTECDEPCLGLIAGSRYTIATYT